MPFGRSSNLAPRSVLRAEEKSACDVADRGFENRPGSRVFLDRERLVLASRRWHQVRMVGVRIGVALAISEGPPGSLRRDPRRARRILDAHFMCTARTRAFSFPTNVVGSLPAFLAGSYRRSRTHSCCGRVRSSELRRNRADVDGCQLYFSSLLFSSLWRGGEGRGGDGWGRSGVAGKRSARVEVDLSAPARMELRKGEAGAGLHSAPPPG